MPNSRIILLQETHVAPTELSSQTAVEVLQQESSYSISQHTEEQVSAAVKGMISSDCGQDQQAALASQHADLATPAIAEQPLAVLAVCAEQPCSHDADQHAERSTDQLSCSSSKTDAMQESATPCSQQSQNADKLPSRQDSLRSASTATSRRRVSADASKLDDQSIATNGLVSSASCKAIDISSHESTPGEDANAQQPAVEAYVGTSPGLAAEMVHHQQTHMSGTAGSAPAADTCGSSPQDSVVVTLSSQQVPPADDGMSACQLSAEACTSKSAGSGTNSASSQQDEGAADHQQEDGAADHQQDNNTADHQQHCSTACVSNPENPEVDRGSTGQAQSETTISSQSRLASCTSSPQSLGAGGISQAWCEANGTSGDQPAEACSGCAYMPPAENASSQQSSVDTNGASQQLSAQSLTSMTHSSAADSLVSQYVHADEGLPDDQSSTEAGASATASCTLEALSSQQSRAAEEKGSHVDLQTVCSKQPVTSVHQVSAASSARQSTAAGQTSGQPCNSKLHGEQARAASSTYAAISQQAAPQAVHPASASHSSASTPQILSAQQDRQQLSSQLHVDSSTAGTEQAEPTAVAKQLPSAQASSQAVDGCIAAQSIYAQAVGRDATRAGLPEAQTEHSQQESAPVTRQSIAADAEAANWQRGQQQPSVAAHVQGPQDAKVPRCDVRWPQQHLAGQHRNADAVHGFAIAMHDSDIPRRLHTGERLPAECAVCP